MKARVQVPDLKDAAQFAAKRTLPRPHRPELAGTVVTVHDGDALTLDATDLTSSGTATLGCDTLQPGRVLVNAAVLARIAAQLPGEDADLTVDGDRLRVQSGSTKFALRCMDLADFPNLAAVDASEAVIDGRRLARLLACVHPAAARSDDAREVLKGVHLSAADGLLTAAATDSYRLHVASCDWTGPDLQALIPADVAQAVAKISTDTTTVAVNGRAAFGMGSREITTQQIEGAFPDWRTLLPDTHEHQVTVQAPDLAAVLKRCAAVGEDSVNGGTQVKVAFTDGRIAVSAGDTSDEGSDTVEADTDDAEFTFAFNSRYLTEALQAVAPDGGDVTLDLRDELKPVVVRAEGARDSDPLALVMPIRL